MIRDCEAGKLDMIITKSISRFARNTLDCLNYVRSLKELGIGVIFEKENINTLDSKGEVLLTILSSWLRMNQGVFLKILPGESGEGLNKEKCISITRSSWAMIKTKKGISS